MTNRIPSPEWRQELIENERKIGQNLANYWLAAGRPDLAAKAHLDAENRVEEFIQLVGGAE